MHDQIDPEQTAQIARRERQKRRWGYILALAALGLVVLMLVLITMVEDVPCTLQLGALILIGVLAGDFFRTMARRQKQVSKVVHQAASGLPEARQPPPNLRISWKRFTLLLAALAPPSILLAVAMFLVTRHTLPGVPEWVAGVLTGVLILVTILPVGIHLVKLSLSSHPETRPPFWKDLLGAVARLILLGATATLAWPLVGWLGAVTRDPTLIALAILAFVLLSITIIAGATILLPTYWVFGPLSRADYDGALRRVRPLRRLRPQNPQLLFLHGTVLLFAGRHEDAEQLLRESLAEGQNSPTDAEAQTVALENLGYALLGQGHYTEAIQAFEGAIETRPDRAGPYSGLAEVYLHQRIQPERALTLTEQALEHKLKSWLSRRIDRYRFGEILGNQAWALALLGRHVEAAETLERALRETDQKFKPALAELHCRAGQVKRLQGDLAAAAGHFDRARQIDLEGNAGRLASQALREMAESEPPATDE